MSDNVDKPATAPVRLARRPSMAVGKSTSYRVSKAQSLRMRAHDRKAEEARKAKKL
jgi:hypothetical protein